MALRYKISILTTATVLIVLIPLSLMHIYAIARVEEEDIRVRLRTIGTLIATGVFASDLGPQSSTRQYFFLKSALASDRSILFIAVYSTNMEKGMAVLARSRFPKRLDGEDWELIQKYVEQQTDPMVKYVSVNLRQGSRLIMGYSISTIEQRRRERQLQAVGWGFGLMLLAVTGSMFFAQWLTRPIRKLTDGMSRIAKGDLKIRLRRQSSDEIGALTQDFNRMVANLRENVMERQRMGQELDIARRIQQKLLPQSEPEIEGLDISGVCLTYAEVGGDYYDYLPLADGRLAIALGDVSGHGVSSGLMAAAVQGCLNNQVSIDPAATKVLSAVDRVVRSSDGHLMTLCYAILDPYKGLVTVASAGHWSPCHYIARTNTVTELYASTDIAPTLGAFPINIYPDHQTSLEPDDVLAFYSDGILETINKDKEMYGEERLRNALLRHAKGEALQIRDAILDEVSQFRGEIAQDDDIALVIVKYKPS